MVDSDRRVAELVIGRPADHRRLPLSLRKASLGRLLSRQVAGIFPADYEQDEIGQDLFHGACRMGLEGIVSKHRDAYRDGRCKHWIKPRASDL
jgi:ATP-dependent DNA ligase